jgi:hypothetical protein
MRIVAEYDRETVHGNGCGGLESRGTMYVNSGGGTAANLAEFDVYAFDLRRLALEPSPPNLPAPPEGPSPDLLDSSPDGAYVYASLRGALPLSGDPHASTGSTPGVGIIRVLEGGKTGELVAIARIANLDAAGIDRADPHGLRVRQK